MPNQTPCRFVSYTRYSTDNQNETSITDQDRANAQLIAREQGVLIEKYSDSALSGQYSDRPDYIRLKADLERDRFDLIVVDEISRLWRNVLEQYSMVELCKYRGIHIIGVNDGIDTRREGFELLLAVKGAQNEDFIRFVSKKTHNSLQGIVIAKLHAGGKIYGYKSRYQETVDKKGNPIFKPNGLAIVPDQAAIVVQIFQWYADGQAPKRIADKLNQEGIPSPRNRAWRASAIYGDHKRGTGILNNKIYIGIYEWNKSKWIKLPETVRAKTGRTGKKERRERDPSEWLSVDMPELRIIDASLWDRVKKRQAATRRQSQDLKSPNTGRGFNSKYLFSGLLTCGNCGSNYVMINKYSYGCSLNMSGGHSACENRIKVPRRLIEEKLLAVIQDELLHPDLFAVFRSEAHRALNAYIRQPNTKQLQDRIARLDAEIGNLVDALRERRSSPALLDALTQAEDKKASLARELTDAQAVGQNITAILPNIEKMYSECVQGINDALSTDTATARERIRAILGDDIRLVPEPLKQHLIAEIRADYAGMLHTLAGVQIGLVAGAGFGQYLHLPEPLRVPIIRDH